MQLRGSVTTVPSTLPVGASSRQQIGLALSLLGCEVLAFHPRLIKLTGSIPAALMLSQSLYWTRKLIAHNDREGWFWKTRVDWRHEIALSRHEQDSARKSLRALPFWQERCIGLPAKMHFRVDLDQLTRQIDRNFKGNLNWQDRQQVLRLLGRPVLVFRPLADLCQSVTAAILFSHFLGEERSALRTGQRQDDWHNYQFDQLLSLTGLTRHELIHAREILKAQGFLYERRVGVPPISQWRLSFPMLINRLRSAEQDHAEITEEITETLQFPISESPHPASIEIIDDGITIPTETRVVDQYAGNQQSSLLVSSILENPDVETISEAQKNEAVLSRNRPETSVVIQLSGIRPTGNPVSGQLEIGKPANWMVGNRIYSRPDSGFLYKGLTTGKPTTETTPSPTPPVQHPKSREAEPDEGGGGLLSNSTSNLDLQTIVWPNLLLAEERSIACRVLSKVGDVAQLILDELAGQNAQAPIQQPLAYLRKLTMQAQAGEFVPSAAMRVAEKRRQQQALLDRQQSKSNVASAPALAPAELSAEQREAARRKLVVMRAGLRLGNPSFVRCDSVSNPASI